MAKKKTGNTFLSTQTQKSYSSTAKKKKDEVAKASSSSSAKKNQEGSSPKSMQKTAETTRQQNAQKNNEARTNLRTKTAEKRNQAKANANKQLQTSTTQKKTSSNVSNKTTKEVTNRLQSKYSGEKSKSAYKTMDKLTQGAERQAIGGYLKTYGDSQNEVEREREHLEALHKGETVTKKAIGLAKDSGQKDKTYTKKISDSVYKQNLEALNKSGKAKMYDETQKAAESNKGVRGKIAHALESSQEWADKTGTQMIKKGNKQISDATENMGTVEKIAAGAYTSGLGMLNDMALGPAWSASMMARTYGTSLVDAEEKGVDHYKATNYAGLQALKETGTEYMFAGAKVPLAMVGKENATDMIFGKVIDAIANKAKTQMGKNLLYSSSKRLMGSAEEATEELVAGLLDPIITNATYANDMGQHEEFNVGETIEAMASAGLMTVVLGVPGAVQVNTDAKTVKKIVEDGYGSVENLAKEAKNVTDPIMSARSQAMYDRVANGNSLADEQVVELYTAVANQYKEDVESVITSHQVMNTAMREEGYIVAPSRRDANGNVRVNSPTNNAYNYAKNKAKKITEKLSLPSTESKIVEQSIAEINSGQITPTALSAFAYQNTEERMAFEQAFNVELPVEYTNGVVDIAKTNQQTKLALIELSQQKAMNLARKETAKHIDTHQGEVRSSLTRGLGTAGQTVMSDAIANFGVDQTVEMYQMGLVVDDFYNAGKYGLSYDEVKGNHNPLHETVDESIRKAAYEAGVSDANNISETPVESGKPIAKTKVDNNSKGELILGEGVKIDSSTFDMYSAIAQNLNINIHIEQTLNVGNTEKRANGYYKNGELYLSVEQVDNGLTMDYTFRHELTHHLKTYAPEEYKALEDYVFNQMFHKKGVDYINFRINSTIAIYKNAGITLSENEAREELIADAMRELCMDNSEINKVCNENTTLAQKILEAIRNIIDKIRSIFATHEGYRPEYNEALLANLDIYKEAEEMYLNAIKKAYENRAKVGLIDSSERYSFVSQEEADEHRQILADQAKEYYGSEYTNDFAEAGYIFPNGKLLKMGAGGIRAEDHYWAELAYEGNRYDNPDVVGQFINEGNIRIMPEAGLINVGEGIEPTAEQYEAIRNYVNWASNKTGKFVELEISEANRTDEARNFGGSVDSKYYGKRANADEVINDIKRFYKTGSIGGSQLSQFRYSLVTETQNGLKNGKLPKELKKWAKDIGLDELKGAEVNGLVSVSVRDLRTAWMIKNGREDEAKAVDAMLDNISSYLTSVVGKYNYIDLSNALNARLLYRTDKDGNPTSVILSCMVKNAEYEMNFDFTTICAKRSPLQKVIERFAREQGFEKKSLYDELNLDEEGFYKLRLILENAGFEVYCKGCFVEQNRTRQQAQANTIVNDYNAAVIEWAKKNGVDVDSLEYFNFMDSDVQSFDYEAIEEGFKNYSRILKTYGEKTAENKNKALVEASPVFRKLLQTTDIITQSGQTGMNAYGENKRGGTTLYGLLKRGQSDSKQALPFVPYNSEVSLLPETKKRKSSHIREEEEVTLYDYLKSIGGIRGQSASDFQLEFIYDYMQWIGDMAARGLPAHIYTKVIEEAELLGMCGIKINLSVMCDIDPNLPAEQAGLNADGDYYVSTESVDYEKAIALQREEGYTKNIGIIMVGMSDAHILKSLDDKNIRYIIGYHKSNMPPIIAKISHIGMATDYTSVNKTTELNDAGKVLFAEAMAEAKGDTELDKFKDALRLFAQKIKEQPKTKSGNNKSFTKGGPGNNTAGFNTYDDLEVTGDPRKTADNYLQWCMDNNYIPMYYMFAYHPNYYKMEVFDFNVYDNLTDEYAPQEAVKNVYPGIDAKTGDTTTFTNRLSEMLDERQAKNAAVDDKYDVVIEEAKRELRYSISEYGDVEGVNTIGVDNKSTGIEPQELTSRADFENAEDATYMQAVANNDMETAQRMVDEAAKRAGYTVDVYHGSTAKDIDEFDPSYRYIDTKRPGWNWFTESRDYASGYTGYDGMIYKGALNPSNLLTVGDVEDEAVWYDEDGNREYSEHFSSTANILGVTEDELFNAVNEDYGGSENFDALDDFFYPPYDSEDAPTSRFLPMYMFTRSGAFREMVENLGYEGIQALEGEGNVTYGLSSSNQFKSTEPITYDDNGQVIPLSERFNSENNDIRYSMPETDSTGHPLSNEQMEFFANSKARDDNGRLVMVYHTTSEGGFTVFDPKFSDDRRSLFFASNEAVSRTYARNKAVDINERLGKPSMQKYIVQSIEISDFTGEDGYYYWTVSGKALKGKSYVDFEKQGRDKEDSYGNYSEFPRLEKALDKYTGGWGYENIDRIRELYFEESLEGENLLGHGLELEYDTTAKTTNIYPVYLNLENPLIVYGNGSYWSGILVDYKNPENRNKFASLPQKASVIVDSMGLEEVWDYDRDEKKDYEQYRHARLVFKGERKNENNEWEKYTISKDAEGEAWDVSDELIGYVCKELGIDSQWFYDDAEGLYDNNGEFFNNDVRVFGKNGQPIGEYEEEFNEEGYVLADMKRMKTRDVSRLAMERGYDGVIIKDIKDVGGKSPLSGNAISDIYIAFRPEQIKLVNNKKPTIDPDIRYAIPSDEEMSDYYLRHQEEYEDITLQIPYDDLLLEESRIRRQNLYEDIKRTAAQRGEQTRRTEQDVLDVKGIKREVREIVKSLMSQTGSPKQYDSKMVDQALEAVKSIHTLLRHGNDLDAATIAFDTATALVEGVAWYDDSLFEDYSIMKRYFRRTVIQVSDDVGDEWFKYYGKRNINRMIVSRTHGKPLEDVWSDLVQDFSDRFGPASDYAEVKYGADMLLAMEEVLDNIYEPAQKAMESEEACTIAAGIADDLMGLATKGDTWLSYADKQKNRYDEMVKKLTVRKKEAVREAIRKERARADKKFNAYRESAERRIKETRIRGAKALEDYKHRQAETKQRKADLKERAKYYGHIVDNYEALCKMLISPDTTKMKLVPQQFRRRLAEVLVQLDLQTERSKQLEETYGISSKTYKQGDLRKALAEISKEDNSGIIEHNEYLFDLLDYIDEQITNSKLFREYKEDDETRYYYETMDLQKLDDLFASLKTGINNINKAFTLKKYQEISETAEDVVETAKKRIKAVGKRDEYTGLIKFMDDLINSSNVTAVDFFEIMGGGMYDCYMSLRRGQDKHIKNYTYLRNYFSEMFKGYNATGKRGRWKAGSDAEKWRTADSQIEFKLESGDIVKLTPSQMMSLYLLAQREQACGHIYSNGIVVAEPNDVKDFKSMLGKKRQIQGGSAHLTENDVINICNSLTDEQKQMATELQRLLRDEVAGWGNETSMQMYGVKLFTEENYFPIYSEETYLEATFDSKGEQTEKIRNFGFTKSLTPGANNAIVVADIFEVVADHCNKMSLYNAFAAPISDFQRVFNYQVKKDGIVHESVRDRIKAAYGTNAEKFIRTFMADLNGTTTMRSDGLSRLYGRLLSNYKKAAIGGNLRVLVQQPTAIIRALDVIAPKYFAKGGIGNPAKDVKEMQEHCPIAAWKAWGNFQNDYSRSLDDIMMNREWTKWDAVTMGIYGVADNATWAVIWRAVKAEVKDTHPEVAYESNEFWDLCAERASYVFDKTQVVDSVFHRSEAMRNKGPAHKLLTAFMAEPTRTFNMLRTDISKARILIAEGNKGEASKIIAKTMAVFVANAALVSFSAAIIDAFRGSGDDDDDKDWLERLMSHWLDNFMDNANILNDIVLIKDIVNLKDGWGTSNMALEGFETIMNSINNMEDFVKGESNKTIAEIVRKFAEGVGYVTGIPVKNILREMDTIATTLGFESFAAEAETSEESSIKWYDYEGHSLAIKDGSGLDNILNRFGINLTEDEKKQREWDETVAEAKEKCEGLTGSELKEKAWDVTMEGYTSDIKDGDFESLSNRRELLAELGGDVDEFDEKVLKQVKSNYKQTIGDSSQTATQQKMLTYMQNNGVSPETISELCYKSDTGRQLKSALIAYDHDAIIENLKSLREAGITYDDFVKLYKNRNSGYDKDYLYKLQGSVSDDGYKWPCSGTITDGFGYRTAPVDGASTYHEGIDIAADVGTAVSAMKSGTVTKAGWNGNYGYQVVVDHGDGTVSYYSHLNDYGVQKGDKVVQGQRIASVGSTGLSTGSHLDFRVSVNGTFVDPLTILQS